MDSKLYHGFTQETWDNLMYEAEDLLRDDKLGNHIVGAYPIPGLAQKLGTDIPYITCLYIDSVETLLNPATKPPAQGTIRTDAGGIFMIDFYRWCKTIIEKTYVSLPWIQAPFGDIIHEDEAISPIVDVAKAYLDDEATREEVGYLVARLYLRLA